MEKFRRHVTFKNMVFIPYKFCVISQHTVSIVLNELLLFIVIVISFFIHVISKSK